MTLRGGRKVLTRVLLAPFGRGQTKALFEHGIEQAQMPIAADVGDADDFGIGIHEQLAGAVEAQFDLPRVKRHAEFLMKQAAEMAFAAMQLPGQFGQRTFGEFGLGHLSDQLPDLITKLVANRGWRRHGQQTGNGVGPQLQQRATYREPVAVRLVGQPRKFLANGFSGRKDGNGRPGMIWRDLELMPFRHREQAVEILRLNGEQVQFQQAKLAGAHDPVGVVKHNQTIAGVELAMNGLVLQPISRAFGHTRYQPAAATREPFSGGWQGQLLQDEMSLDNHHVAKLEAGCDRHVSKLRQFCNNQMKGPSTHRDAGLTWPEPQTD